MENAIRRAQKTAPKLHKELTAKARKIPMAKAKRAKGNRVDFPEFALKQGDGWEAF
jgi:hypothetical protein